MLRVISLFDPCSLYQMGFRGDIYLLLSVRRRRRQSPDFSARPRRPNLHS